MHRARIVVYVSVAIYASAAHAQVVQLPTFHFFTVHTTVSAPDSGRGLAAALQRSRRRRPMQLQNIRGLNNPLGQHHWLANRGHNELNKVAAADARQIASKDADLQKADFLSSHVARQIPAEKLFGVAEIRRRNALSDQRKDADAEKYFAQGQEAQAKGSQGVARIYYRMAAKRATGKFKAQILARIESINSALAVKTMANNLKR